MATSNEQTKACKSCNSCSNLEDDNVVVFELKGLEKSFVLAKILKNEEFLKVKEFAVKKGYKTDVSDAKVSKIISNIGQAVITDIPFANVGEELSGIAIIDDGSSKKVIMYEIKNEGGKLAGGIYYVNNGKVRYQPLSNNEYWGCLWDCVGGLSGIAGCGGSCAACIGGGFWTCLTCAACLGNAGCCVGECALEEPWDAGFCSAVHMLYSVVIAQSTGSDFGFSLSTCDSIGAIMLLFWIHLFLNQKLLEVVE
jgi:hypothetical protein